MKDSWPSADPVRELNVSPEVSANPPSPKDRDFSQFTDRVVSDIASNLGIPKEIVKDQRGNDG